MKKLYYLACPAHKECIRGALILPDENTAELVEFAEQRMPSFIIAHTNCELKVVEEAESGSINQYTEWDEAYYQARFFPKSKREGTA